jgi:GWxTD domain-containing protein
MKKIILLLLLSISLFMANANVRAFLSYTTFYSPTDGSYMETYLSIVGKSLKYSKLSNGKFQANLEILYTFERNDSIKSFQKIALKSPEIIDTTEQYMVDFLSVERFAVPTGTYNFKISIRDLNTKDDPTISQDNINIFYPKDKASISGIQLISNYEKTAKNGILTKYGYDIYPYFSNFYPDFIKSLMFYYETYNTKLLLGEKSKFITKYYIEEASSHQKIAPFITTNIAYTSEANVNFGKFDISKLPSGNYNLVVEATDTTGTVMAFNRLYFQRSNPKLIVENTFSTLDISNTFVAKINDFDTLRLYLHYLYPINKTEDIAAQNSILLDQKQNMDSIIISKEYRKQKVFIMQQYFYDFWKRRNMTDPEKGWLDYLTTVNEVNAKFSAQRTKGFLTDRGRVYLQYGPPNSISAETMGADSYPYEIWQYYQIKAQGNRKFVFYNYDRVSNSYILLHSDVFGEIYEPQWQKILRNRRQNSVNSDIKTADPVWGDHSIDFWNNPR